MNDWPHYYHEDDLVTVDNAGTFTVGTDNGASVYIKDLPDRMAFRDPHPRAGEFGGPPEFNRWVTYDRVKPMAWPRNDPPPTEERHVTGPCLACRQGCGNCGASSPVRPCPLCGHE